MNERQKTLLIPLYFLIINGLSVSQVNAASCYGSLDNRPDAIGNYISCVVPTIWSSIQIIFATIATVSLMIFLFMVITKRSDSKFLETVPTRARNMIFFILLVAGFGGTLLSIFLTIFGLPTIVEYINKIKEVITISSQ